MRYGYGYVRRMAGVDIERQCFDLRTLLIFSGFRLKRPIIVDGADGAGLVELLRLIQTPDNPVTVFVPQFRHLSGRIDLVRLYAPV